MHFEDPIVLANYCWLEKKSRSDNLCEVNGPHLLDSNYIGFIYLKNEIKIKKSVVNKDCVFQIIVLYSELQGKHCFPVLH